MVGMDSTIELRAKAGAAMAATGSAPAATFTTLATNQKENCNRRKESNVSVCVEIDRNAASCVDNC